MSRILRNPNIVEAIPSIAKSFETPTVVYNLNQAIGSKIFNFNRFTKSLDVKTFLENPESLPCCCASSPFIDKDHQHIITGDLRIVENTRLRKLLSRGPKFRESR